MDLLNGATIFWLIALGLIAGAGIKVVLGNRGISLVGNLIFGVSGSVVCGIIFLGLALPGSIVLSVLGSVCIIFIINVFYLQPEHTEHEVEENTVLS